MDRRLLLWLFFPAALGCADPERSPSSTPEPFLGQLQQDEVREAEQDATAVGEDYNYEDYDKEFDNNEEIFQVQLCKRTSDGNFSKSTHYFNITDEDISDRLNLPDGMRSPGRVLCTVYNRSQFRCGWTARKLPSDTHVSLLVSQTGDDDAAATCNCSSGPSGQAVECGGTINPDKVTMTIRILLLRPDLRYIHTQHFNVKKIEKLNPPHDITMSLTAGDLHIKWDRPQNIGENCFHYQLRLNNGTELTNVTKQRMHTLPNIDPARKYSVQIRVKKTDICMENHVWSDWSDAVVLNAVRRPSGINALKIVGIGLGAPMILLAILLFCRFHRVYDKICPQIPGPPKAMKILLEREQLFPAMKTKCSEEMPEHVTVVEC